MMLMVMMMMIRIMMIMEIMIMMETLEHIFYNIALKHANLECKYQMKKILYVIHLYVYICERWIPNEII